MLRTLLRVLAVAAALAGRPALAQVAGQDDPRFAEAVGAWLDGADAEPLRDLAGLAAEGNRAAQILLALIDVTPELEGPWLDARPREERIALMRRPGGMSGQGWMAEAATDTALARLWIERWDTAATAETALGFAALGEARAARETLLALAARQYPGFAAIAEDRRFPPPLRAFAAAIQADDAREPSVPTLDDWLAREPLAAPLRAFCDATCPASAGGCLRAAYTLVGEEVGLATAGTPSETLIPPEIWDASPRGRAAILRQPEARDPVAGAWLAGAVSAQDTCTGAALAEETARF